jgi:hypothetical protein
VLADLGKRDAAEREYRAALKELERLAAEHPQVADYREELARSHNSLGILLAGLGKGDDTEREYGAAIKEYERLAGEQPQVSDYRTGLAGSLGNLAMLRNKAKEWREARKLLERAAPHHAAALKAAPRNVIYRRFFRNNLTALLESLLALGDHAAAAQAARKLTALAFEPSGDTYDAACAFARCGPLALKDASLPESKRQELARSYADEAMALLRQAVARGWKDAAHMQQDPDLNPLRNRDDFKKLIADLEAAAKKR